MKNFDTELDRQGVKRIVKQVTFREEVTVIKAAPPVAAPVRKAYMTKMPTSWEWRDLRDYLETEAASRGWDVDTTNDQTTQRILSAFLKRWAPNGGAIAKYVFTHHDGLWMNEPLTVTRFLKANDPFFAKPISDSITSSSNQSW